MTITKWQDLESKGAAFLNTLFPCVQFTGSGGSNANESDIIVTNQYGGNTLFKIEAKMTPAQAGQITVVDDGSFSLSEQSTNPDNIYTNQIIDYLNENYQDLSPAGRTGKALNIPENILINWVKEHYHSKGNSWILSIEKNSILSKASLTLVPINELEQYFTVNTVFRIKQSGSSNISRSRREEAIQAIQEAYPSVNVNSDIVFDSKKMYLTAYIGSGKQRLSNGYFIGAIEDNRYVITRRNMTENPNPNIMFEIRLKQQCFQENEFKNFLKSHEENC
ncbi:hypothetical protein [Sulfurimonas sp.]